MPDEATPAPDLERLESTMRVLASQRRLHALVVLRRRAPMSLTSLAEAVAARESGIDGDDAPADLVARTRETLYHVHVPKLQEIGVVEFDAEAETIRLTDRANHVETVVDALFDA